MYRPDNTLHFLNCSCKRKNLPFVKIGRHKRRSAEQFGTCKSGKSHKNQRELGTVINTKPLSRSGAFIFVGGVFVSIKEFGFSSILAIFGTIVSTYLGGWDVALKVMVFCMIVDYVTGVLGAIREKKLNSEVMFWGGVRKAVIFVVVGLAVMLDELVGNDSPVFRTLALYFYIGREGLSIVENLGHLGIPLPGFIEKVLDQLKEKGDKNETG